MKASRTFGNKLIVLVVIDDALACTRLSVVLEDEFVLVHGQRGQRLLLRRPLAPVALITAWVEVHSLHGQLQFQTVRRHFCELQSKSFVNHPEHRFNHRPVRPPPLTVHSGRCCAVGRRRLECAATAQIAARSDGTLSAAAVVRRSRGPPQLHRIIIRPQRCRRGSIVAAAAVSAVGHGHVLDLSLGSGSSTFAALEPARGRSGT